MLKLILQWLLTAVGIGGAIVGILGIIMAVDRAFHAIDGRPHDRFLGYSEQDGVGIVYTIILNCGFFGLLYGLGLSFAGSMNDIFVDLQSAGFIYGGLLGLLHLLSVLGINAFISGEDGLDNISGNLVLNGIVSGIFCTVLGCVAGIMLGMNDPALMLVKDEVERAKLAGQNAWGTAILLSGIGAVLGVLIGAIGSMTMGFLLPLAKMIHGPIVPFATAILGKIKYKPLLCHTCFQYSQPGRSPYQDGNRFCEYCHHQIPRTADTPGRLIVTFGKFEAKRKRRLYILADPDLKDHDVLIEVSAIGINTASCDPRLLKNFISYIVEYPPTAGLRSIGVLYKGNLDELGEELKQALRDNFGSVRSVARATRR